MPESERSIMRYLVAGRNVTLVNPEYVLKINPKLSIEKFVQKIEELIIDGKMSDAINLLNVLKNQELFVFRGSLCQAEGIMSTHRIEQFIKTDVERKLRSTEDDSTGKKRAYEIYAAVNAELNFKEKRQLQKERTSIWIVDESEIRRRGGRRRYRVMACRYIPTYNIEAIDGNREGTWQFPECYIGVNIDIARGGLAISAPVFVVHPRNYIHPFVYSGHQKMCLGSGASKVKNKLSETSSAYRLIKLLIDAGEQVLRSGYNKPKRMIAPANGHIWESKYNRQDGYPKKISDSVTDEFRKMLEGYKIIRKKAKQMRRR